MRILSEVTGGVGACALVCLCVGPDKQLVETLAAIGTHEEEEVVKSRPCCIHQHTVGPRRLIWVSDAIISELLGH